MKILKRILIVLLIIVAIPFVIALFVKKDYKIERSIVINRPNPEVFSYIRNLKNQDHYSKWVQTDPNMKKDYRGVDGEVGFVYAWNGNDEAGRGEQEIKAIEPNKKVDVEVRFEKPFKSIAYTPLETNAIAPGQTEVRWGMHGTSAYPLNFMNLFMDDVLGKDLETSLASLKTILEKKG